MQTEQEADKEETAPGVLPDRVRIKLTLAYVGTHYHG